MIMGQAPKGITSNPLVEECESGEWGGTKRYFVHLIEGYWFASHETGSKSFDTVREFKDELIERRPLEKPKDVAALADT